ncbi:MAG: Signal transduction histidine kinase [Gemmatimonadetes bacterium]|nr:Signal transduction histidine kinase [Gemmatimonadota bacterium]
MKLLPLRPRTPLDRLRLRLTAWYVGMFAGSMLIMRLLLVWSFARQVSMDLDRSLRGTTEDMLRAVRIREAEGAPSRLAVLDAVDALDDPNRPLYLFDGARRSLRPRDAEPRIRAAAATALRAGQVDYEFTTAGGQRWRLFGQLFRAQDGTPYVVVAVADLAEIDAERARLVQTLLLNAALALVLMTGGGLWLARISVRPVEAVMEHMRRFMADAAHELRTPLAVLRGRAELALEQERPPAAYQSALAEILRESERLGSIVEHLFTLARADAGERQAAHEPFYLDDVASDAVQAAGVLARARGVRLELGTYEEAPLVGDPGLVRQLLMLLLDNAVKFTPAGGTVRVDVSAEGGRPAVVVQDTGAGIAPEALPHVFDRFYREDPARTRTGGAGLGLSIARWIADQHGAELAIESQPGRGTRVTVRFPARV